VVSCVRFFNDAHKLHGDFYRLATEKFNEEKNTLFGHDTAKQKEYFRTSCPKYVDQQIQTDQRNGREWTQVGGRREIM
jgi:hypothetical protein